MIASTSIQIKDESYFLFKLYIKLFKYCDKSTPVRVDEVILAYIGKSILSCVMYLDTSLTSYIGKYRYMFVFVPVMRRENILIPKFFLENFRKVHPDHLSYLFESYRTATHRTKFFIGAKSTMTCTASFGTCRNPYFYLHFRNQQ